MSDELRISSAENVDAARALAAQLKPDSMSMHFDPNSTVLLLKRQHSRRDHQTIGRIRVSGDRALLDQVEQAVRAGAGWEDEA